ncbi:MAG: hypothetical protein A2015_07450 [Spirochaetes bacterium GWF1_31_7]|nr:MAG: hypothetical protein A2Y30_02830 [Spirochaetes bacterium GWE1_32_154]OHD47592.1 MAG: hypothetical protein A2Y29_00275 [Spirochaetes bacterium GWE2_31_10]OHD51252.1 MAG: hypothetical protein A2015_07450 [Spirochaetes bacterium GWF1_31_7]OHD81618.1 MAG: hypothetical protein A2355_11065 [Spirochaetes bacterium RIFOXYB1_FULL_32_8]
MLNKRSDNRRKQTRFSVDVDGFYYYGGKWVKCKIYDLNLDGAGLRLNQFFVKDDIIKLKFGIDDELNSIDSVVVNVNGPRIGVHFVNVDEFDVDFLRRVINSLSKRFKI